MENGVKDVEEEVRELNVEEFDGDRLKHIEKDEVFEEASDGVEEATGTPRVIQTVMEEPRVIFEDPVGEVVSVKVIDQESTSDNVSRENEESVDKGKDEVNSLVQESDEKNASYSLSRDQALEMETDESRDKENDEAKVLNLVEVIDEKSTCNVSRDQLSELETVESVGIGKDEVKAVSDEQIIHNNGVMGEVNMLENDMVISSGINVGKELLSPKVNGGQMEIAKDLDELNEKPVVVVSGNSDNGVPDNVALDEAVIHRDSVSGDSISQESSPVDGESKIEFGGDISNKLHQEVNGKHILDTVDGVGDSGNQAENVESSGNSLPNLDKELKVEQTKEEILDQGNESAKCGYTSAINEPDDSVEGLNPEDCIQDSAKERTVAPEVEIQHSLGVKEDVKIEGNSTRAGNGVKHSEPVASPSGKCESIDNELKENTPVIREPNLEPAIGVSLSTPKSASSSSVSNPRITQSPVPDPRRTAAPSPAPSAAPTHPAGLGHGAPLLEPAPRVVQAQVNGTVTPTQNQVIDNPTNGEAEENDETREKLQMIRVKFLRLARRLGQTPHNVVVAQVLYRLGLAEQLRGRNGGRVAAFSFERANDMAEQLEAAGQEPLEFSCTIMVLGKTGVGKSATINSIFDEVKFDTDAFQLGTKKVQDVVGTVQGIKVRVIDTPGLLPSWADQRKNEKILHSVKRFIQKSPPDIVLYLDRLDMQSREFGDMPLLHTISDIFGPSIWFNAIVVLTHAASAPPEGPNGTTTSYDMFVTHRTHAVQQAIRQAAGDMRLMNPVSLVENHSACRTNRAGQRVLPNGQVWKPHLLLLSFASKILVEANMLLKLQDTPPGKPFAARTRAPPLPFILSNLLQSRPQLKLPQEQFGVDDEDSFDGDLDESSDEESSEYDELPPFKRLSNAQLEKLSKAQKKAYYDELEYREKLFMKKQLKEEKKRRKMMKTMSQEAKDQLSAYNDNNSEEDSNGTATVPVVPDMHLPASFDSDNPAHRYRTLDSSNPWLVRPVLDPHGWDHDVGYEGINAEHLFAVRDKIPVSFSGQVTKDKKDANVQMEVASSVKHGEGKSTTLAFDLQTVGKEMGISYTLRSETRFINYRQNKATAGLSATYFGDSLTTGVKFEDKLMINKRGQLVVAGGAVIGRGDIAYGGSLEATLRDKDYPLGRFLSTIGLSVMDWHGDLALGWNAQSQIPIGRSTNLIGRVNLNNKGSGQVSVRLNSSEQLQIALVSLIPLISKLVGYYQPRDSAY